MINNITSTSYISTQNIFTNIRSIDWRRSVIYLKDLLLNNLEITAISTLAIGALFTLGYIKRRQSQIKLKNKKVTHRNSGKQNINKRALSKPSPEEKKARTFAQDGKIHKAIDEINKLSTEEKRYPLFTSKIYAEVYKKRDIDLLIDYRNNISDAKAKATVTSQICGFITSEISTLLTKDPIKNLQKCKALFNDKLKDQTSRVKIANKIMTCLSDENQTDEIRTFIQEVDSMKFDSSKRYEMYRHAVKLLCAHQKFDDAEKVANMLSDKKDIKTLEAFIEKAKKHDDYSQLPKDQLEIVKELQKASLDIDLDTIKSICTLSIDEAKDVVKKQAKTPQCNIYTYAFVKRCYVNAKLIAALEVIPNITSKNKRENLYSIALTLCEVSEYKIVIECMKNIPTRHISEAEVKNVMKRAALDKTKHEDLKKFIKKLNKHLKQSNPYFGFLYNNLLVDDAIVRYFGSQYDKTENQKSVKSNFITFCLDTFGLDEQQKFDLTSTIAKKSNFDFLICMILIVDLINNQNSLTVTEICDCLENMACRHLPEDINKYVKSHTTVDLTPFITKIGSRTNFEAQILAEKFK